MITGMGALTPIGNTVEEFWRNALAGKSGIDHTTLIPKDVLQKYPSRITGEVRGFNAEDYMERREARRMARFGQFAVATAKMAIADAELDLDNEDRERVGVVLGNGIGALQDVEEAVRDIDRKGGMRIDPLFLPKMLANMAAAQVAIQFGAKGYLNTHITACAASTQAMGEAIELIRTGKQDVVLTGGTEAAISETGVAGFCVLRALSTRNDEPQRASRPFDSQRDGFIASEGAAIFVLESEDHARARGARVMAEMAGHAASADAYHIVAPCADGEGAARTMRWALADAGISTDEVDYINAHGTSTPLNDSSETAAIKAVFGESAYQVPVSSTKSMVGHALGASGAIESIACVKAIETGMLPPTINYENPDPECDLDYVPNEARRADPRVILKNSFGFGGQNACLVFKTIEA
ncbi:MAG: beta-ketoacyl-ACP synthase II [Dehalococcoidia bacterium]|nr:beta-ketoacyl-ACP synthase II [Dehalococcoidia bacterium]